MRFMFPFRSALRTNKYTERNWMRKGEKEQNRASFSLYHLPFLCNSEVVEMIRNDDGSSHHEFKIGADILNTSFKTMRSGT